MDYKEEFKKINKKLVERYSKLDDSEEFWAYLYKPLRPSIRINTLKGNLKEIKALLEEKFELEPIPWTKGEGFYIKSYDVNYGQLIEYSLGLIIPQEASSMIPPVVLDPKPSEVILDMAAAPGSKTTQMAQYMENEGCIIANDAKRDRANILIANLTRAGVLIAKVTVKDGAYFARYENTFDRVLLDAPCSSVGMIRKNFKFARTWSIGKVYYHSRLQKRLILAAYKSLKPGGVLVYSTCTVDPLENEEVVDFLLQKTDAKLEKVKLPLKTSEPVIEWEGRKYSDEVRKTIRIHPQDNDTEAFYIAKIRKPR
ncbi:tRNA (cytosine(49)-C(5))-methyltransferase [Pyrococcus abyssi]|uniref:tRNA (cytosine(49)-C(5))-methyltransferase n=1 Tax=Pyrococcus abyssi (strain GE5 / Orsay) TaxID=272844 RepID=TRCM_PYRAB|nr:tRNA (cytosine(49)-C(5))-methyltransferase [Pyrococcus abyssi]Q9V106.1 RecName: Full=tRNA (cytosine(49)-C(5))-methyltransferase [Pyrococcus abyssi GE5]CAB49545.1 Sun/NOL1/NOP2 nucleolar protein [Pyrococcus abyssi GE5]CCE70017.1 TPA: proliferating-cell nucleolar antigen P120, putative [Pyrococcus abyssi GE5]